MRVQVLRKLVRRPCCCSHGKAVFHSGMILSEHSRARDGRRLDIGIDVSVTIQQDVHHIHSRGRDVNVRLPALATISAAALLSVGD